MLAQTKTARLSQTTRKTAFSLQSKCMNSHQPRSKMALCRRTRTLQTDKSPLSTSKTSKANERRKKKRLMWFTLKKKWPVSEAFSTCLINCQLATSKWRTFNQSWPVWIEMKTRSMRSWLSLGSSQTRGWGINLTLTSSLLSCKLLKRRFWCRRDRWEMRMMRAFSLSPRKKEPSTDGCFQGLAFISSVPFCRIQRWLTSSGFLTIIERSARKRKMWRRPSEQGRNLRICNNEKLSGFNPTCELPKKKNFLR